ncbi:MAG: nitroreductase family protein [Acholeplasmatales bacterium]|nr:MAG: nitroreductase family protein [Acholeplasmatales bacterium]
MSLCLKRKSIRHFTAEPVAMPVVETLLKSAMQAPSARNQQPWAFIVIRNRQLLDTLSTMSPGAKPLARAPIAICPVIRPDMPAPKMVQQDLAAATQNILLEAVQQNLGAVWIGVCPHEDRIAFVREHLPLQVGDTPFCLIAIGHPAEDTTVTAFRYDPSRLKVID